MSRNDVNAQALQPTPNQVEWALDTAVHGKLRSPTSGRADTVRRRWSTTRGGRREEPAHHAGGQFRFGRDGDLLANSGIPAAVWAAGPGARGTQFLVQSTVRVPAPTCVNQGDGDLGVPRRSQDVSDGSHSIRTSNGRLGMPPVGASSVR